jgi:two-component system sensor histidine kinase AtoS
MLNKVGFPTLKRHRRVSADELNHLLDMLDSPALLADSNNEIHAANGMAAELSAYTRKELTGEDINMLFPYTVGGGELLLTIQNLTNQTLDTTLKTRNLQRIPVNIQIKPLGSDEQLTLLTFQPIEFIQRQLSEHQRLENRLQEFGKLIQVLKRYQADIPLNQLLEIGSQLIDAGALVLYLGDGQNPRLRKSASWGKGNILPNEVPAHEIQHLIKPSLWLSGQRSIVTLVHHIVRTEGFTYMASAPVGDEKGQIGALIATGDGEPDPETLTKLIDILATTISISIQQNTLVQNLRKNIALNTDDLLRAKVVNNAVEEALLVLTPDLQIHEINSAAEIILGYASKEVEGQPFDNILIGTSQLQPAIRLALQGVPTHNIGNANLHRRDGSEFPVHIQTIPVQKEEDDNKIIGVLIVIQDISEHEQIRLRTQQLEQRALLGQVTAVFAHEVRNPINNIDTGLQLMAMNLPEDDQSNRETISRIQQDCTRLSELMDSILTFSKTGNYRFTSVNLENLLERLINRWRPHMTRVNVQHHIQTLPGTRPVLADQRALEQVFTNLISNAVHAMNDTGGTLAVKISPQTAPSGRKIIQVDVSDTGPGIPEENRLKIFEPFFTTNPNGTGLGLSICKQIITTHKGSIKVTSFPGGTVFHVKIPAIEEENEYIL